MVPKIDLSRRTASVTPWLTPDQFAYTLLDDELALLRLLGRLGHGHKPPKVARLVVRRDRLATPYRPRSGADARHGPVPRLRLTRRGLLWEAAFEVPLNVIEAPEAQFLLAADRRVVIALPVPYLLERAAAAEPRPAWRPALAGQASRYAVALIVGVAAAAAVSAGTSANADTAPPASAGAGSSVGDGSSSTATDTTSTSPSTTPTTTDTIQTSADTTSTSTETTPSDPTSTDATTTSTETTTTSTETTTTSTDTTTTSTDTTTTSTPTPTTTAPTSTGTGSPAPVTSTPATPQTTPSPHPSAPATKRHRRRHLRRHHTSDPARTGLGTNLHDRRPAAAHLHHPARHTGPHESQKRAAAAPQSIVSVITDPITIDPFTAAQIAHFESIGASLDQPPAYLIPIYRAAGTRYRVPWQILAAINAIETDYGRNLSVSPTGAIGWMQFEPATWRRYGISADGSKAPNPYDPRDAIFSAARYLAASGAPEDMRDALFAYNHALWYVDAVLWRSQLIAGTGLGQLGPTRGYALPLDARYMQSLGRTDDGVDIETAPDGAAVYSITPGIVTAVASDPSGFGPNYPVVLVTAGPLAGQYVYYGHVAASLVVVGQHVLAGQPIAVIGHTGNAATLGHGHIEIGFSDGSGDPLNHGGTVAWTPAGDAMRHVLVTLSGKSGLTTQ